MNHSKHHIILILEFDILYRIFTNIYAFINQFKKLFSFIKNLFCQIIFPITKQTFRGTIGPLKNYLSK